MNMRHRQSGAAVVALVAIVFVTIWSAGTSFPTAFAQSAGSATLSLSPAGGSYAAGVTFTVSVMLNGGGVGVNAANGELSFDPTLLAVQSIDKGNSVFNLWTSNPSFSNTAGTVDFSGGSNTAYSGTAGDVLDVTFQTLATGTAAVKFSSASALAADGQGTDILGGTTGGSYTIGGSGTNSASAAASTSGPSASQLAAAQAAAAAAASAAAAPAPTPFMVTIPITSPTDPSQTAWYNNNAPNFTWQLTPDVAGVSTAFDKNPGTYPKRISAGLLSSKQYSNVNDGTWYFHVRFEDAVGDWSDPINFQVNIDTAPPLPFTVTAEPGVGVNGRTDLMFDATDTTSGIDHYVATFDGVSSSTIAVSDLQNGTYTAPPLLPGKHTVEIDAFDKAGNETSENVAFTISGVAMPNITNFPATIVERSPIVIEGTADTGANVTVDLYDASGKVASEGKMVADETGYWLYAVESGLGSGKYTLGVSMVTTQGAVGSSTQKLSISVVPAPFLDRFGWAIIVLLLSLIAGILIFHTYRKKILAMQISLAKRENEEAREKTKAVFEALREEVEEQVNRMDGGAAHAQGAVKLEPENVLDAMRSALGISETTIQKEIEDVDKALNEE
jgi:cell division protein FtsB